MDGVKQTALTEGATSLGAFPDAIARMNKLLAEKFSTSLSEVEVNFQKEWTANTGMKNAKLTALKSTVIQEVADAIGLLGNVIGWVMVLLPPIEDGGNFGVGIQLDAAKGMKEQKDALQKLLDIFVDYHEKRAGVVDKIIAKTSSKSECVASSKEDKGGKDGDQHIRSKSSCETSTTMKPAVVEDYVLTVIAMDVKFYLNLHLALKAARDALLYSGAMVENNIEKIKNPKSKGGGHHMY